VGAAATGIRARRPHTGSKLALSGTDVKALEQCLNWADLNRRLVLESGAASLEALATGACAAAK
jgi:hypothetical protein